MINAVLIAVAVVALISAVALVARKPKRRERLKRGE